jgi:hypothetical protein
MNVFDLREHVVGDYGTFRVLRDKERARFGEYRTRRLMLEAWDRHEHEGTPR